MERPGLITKKVNLSRDGLESLSLYKMTKALVDCLEFVGVQSHQLL